ncbi:MAG: hypothetical protein ACLPVW_02855 [Terriglobales bacterium]
MNGFLLRVAFLVLLASAALAQQAPESTPTANTANQQQETTQPKKFVRKKVYHNSDLASPETKSQAEKDSAANPVAGSAAVKAGGSATPAAQAPSGASKTNPPAAEPSRSPIFDSPKDLSPDVIVVPAGTKIQVNILDGNVTVPVRVGWATPIPALTKVTVEVSVPYDPAYGPYYDDPYSAEVAQLTAVTLDGTNYDLQTDQVPVLLGSEATFTLLADLTLKP